MLSLLLLAAAAATPTLPPYAESIRCAGLAEADAEQSRSDLAFDAAIYWGMAASEAARNNGVSAERFAQDQKEAATKAKADLETGQGILEELVDCLAAAPPLPAKSKRR
jgi:hypothetical protein